MTTTAPWWDRQLPSGMPSHRYRAVHDRVALPSGPRSWPDARLTAAPLWVPVDLRDGNQALPEPMDPERKRRMFELLVAMGYKEVEVGYPSASQTDFDFVRLLAGSELAPPDVTVSVFTAARRDLVERTVESVRGLRGDVLIHLYVATAPLWRRLVLRRSRQEVLELVLAGARDVLELAGDLPRARFQFSPEVFNLTEPEFALEVCDRVTALWEASTDRPVVLNLPVTVEAATPNVYADQIEWMHRSLARREAVILSVHPHNDRGTGVACAELALLAGAQRVEGCVFGNGERTGNVDLATLALNLHAQGVDPRVDFSDIDAVRRTVEECTGIAVHERHPYVGSLVHSAFSGTHQDAIAKGFAALREEARAAGVDPRELAWEVPYLPVDPADLGRSYDAVVRVNSQSGKGGAAYLLRGATGIELPRAMQVDYARHVQRLADDEGGEVDGERLARLLHEVYAPEGGGVVLHGWHDEHPLDGAASVTVDLAVEGERRTRAFPGAGPVEALVLALAERGVALEVRSLAQQSLGAGSAARAVSFLEYAAAGTAGWALGLDSSTTGANLAAVVSAARRLVLGRAASPATCASGSRLR
ncbi:2-isopropylmalate synthase [Motilibacter rhizosphaerae]|uniref:2-isopropylmalate synthase n=1 Tax=Motilibacter rhizosphaerae TaxID=598652 RepID=A0A4Q7NSF1_9ACTN|nr:2-isopropylmalate synthase [Motilibacter rhizosphaerae]RZS90056.1 2-isopropylmalate synthase [Motilibacter rhizosphaerae]